MPADTPVRSSTKGGRSDRDTLYGCNAQAHSCLDVAPRSFVCVGAGHQVYLIDYYG
jgi:hypothetical protein